MSTHKSIILAAIATSVIFYLGHIYSQLPMEVHHKIYEIGSIIFVVATIFLLLFFIIDVTSKKKRIKPNR